jgi:hypothetical protein
MTTNFLLNLSIDTEDKPIEHYSNIEGLAFQIKKAICGDKPFFIDLDNQELTLDSNLFKPAIYILYKSKITQIPYGLFYYYNYYFYGLLKHKPIRYSLVDTWYNIFLF